MITVNVDKAKVIAHGRRREARSKEFEPYDAIITKRIPGVAEQEAEAARQVIRDKYAAIQAQIDETSDVVTLKQIVDTLSS